MYSEAHEYINSKPFMTNKFGKDSSRPGEKRSVRGECQKMKELEKSWEEEKVVREEAGGKPRVLQEMGPGWSSLFCRAVKTLPPAAPQAFDICFSQLWTSLVTQMVKRLFTVRETRVRSLDWEDPMEKKMAIHSRTIAWKIPWKEEPGRLQSMGSQRV